MRRRRRRSWKVTYWPAGLQPQVKICQFELIIIILFSMFQYEGSESYFRAKSNSRHIISKVYPSEEKPGRTIWQMIGVLSSDAFYWSTHFFRQNDLDSRRNLPRATRAFHFRPRFRVFRAGRSDKKMDKCELKFDPSPNFKCKIKTKVDPERVTLYHKKKCKWVKVSIWAGMPTALVRYRNSWLSTGHSRDFDDISECPRGLGQVGLRT